MSEFILSLAILMICFGVVKIAIGVIGKIITKRKDK